MAENSTSNLLIVIVDTNPLWWGRKGTKNEQLSLAQCMDCVVVLGNSHLMLGHRNKLAILAAHTDHSSFLYPRPGSEKGHTIQLPEDGQHDSFEEVEGQVKFHLTQLIESDKANIEDQFEEKPRDSLIAGAMSMALCYAHRSERECPIGISTSVRILVVKGSEDCPSQYMNFMNSVFTAQKQNIVIDACIVDTDSGLLQQACDITGGIYLKVPQPAGLLEYLTWVFLPDQTMRSKMAFPSRTQVDYRAACFCHRNLIDIGYVCSVCLSIYCTFSPICTTCQTTFKILGPPKCKKKKPGQKS